MKKGVFCTLISLLALSACGQQETVAYESLVWVNNYYLDHPVQTVSATAGGWLFRGAQEFKSEIRVEFIIPEPMNPDRAKRQALLRSICPAKSEVIWQTLPSKNKIVISVQTKDRKFTDSRVC